MHKGTETAAFTAVGSALFTLANLHNIKYRDRLVYGSTTARR
jgi:hypothetical protein